MKDLIGIIPRAYQQTIFETAEKHNTLVVLPTGMGKTLIALMLSIHYLKKFPQGKILFLAPTRPLAAQHHTYFNKHLPELFAETTLFTGKINAGKRQELWQQSSIIFSTPQCITNDIKSGNFDLSNVSLLIEDECHRCLKNYDYTFIAEKYKEQSHDIRILGMTASPGSKPDIIKKVCANLGITAVEIRHRNSDDVKEYIQELHTEIIKVELPEEFKKIRDLIDEIYQKRIDELKNRKLLFGQVTKTNILALQSSLHKRIAMGDKHFNILRGVSVCAQAIKISHAIELIETQNIATTFKYFQNLMEQAEQGKSKAATQLVNHLNFKNAHSKILELIKKGIEHPKLAELKNFVLKELEENPNAKVIIFNQYRDSIAKICKMLNELNDPLKKEGRIKARVFVGQTKKGDTGMSQKEQQKILNEFKDGEINILCASSVGEEGLDIPEVNAVIFYEPIPSAIRQIQRRGRTARLMPGKLIILMAKKTRDEINYWAAYHKEKKMYSVLDGIQKQFNNKTNKKKQKKIGEFK